MSAEHGADLLDEYRPGWWRRVNLLTLDMASIDDCVLGQEFGCYDIGLGELGIDDEESIDYGFTTGYLLTEEEAEDAWYWLNQDWVFEITERRDNA